MYSLNILKISFWLADSCLFTMSSHGLSSVHTHSWCLPLFLQGHQSYWIWAPPYDLTHLHYLLKDLSPRAVTSAVRLQHTNLRGHNSMHNKVHVKTLSLLLSPQILVPLTPLVFNLQEPLCFLSPMVSPSCPVFLISCNLCFPEFSEQGENAPFKSYN